MVWNGSVLTKVRNEIVQRFWDAGEDVLLFLDSDMAWNAIDAVKLILRPEDIACINYRTKTEEDRWVCYLPGASTPQVKDGMIRVMDAGTGFFKMTRECIRQMREAYPDLEYKDRNGAQIFALFDFSLRDGAYWGEDYTFCERWRAIGGEIWMLPNATVDHIGQKTYTGNYHEYLLQCPGGSKAKE